MARLLLSALRGAGFAPEVPSTLRTYEGEGSEAEQLSRAAASSQETERLLAEYRRRPRGERPRLWFTYHVYYKAPDWIGPSVASALGIPYVIAEGSRAPKRAGGPWDFTHRAAEAALDQAAMILALTGKDIEAIERARPPGQTVALFPPFLDLTEWPQARPSASGAGVRLLTVAMMRHGDKLASYRILAEALSSLDSALWSLDIVGDGEAAEVVQRLFPDGSRVRFHGRIDDRERLASLYEAADIFAWPAVNEAYGMAMLEAQAFGCAVVAGREGGVESIMVDGETGLLVEPRSVTAFARALSTLIENRLRLSRMCAAARRFASRDRSIASASERLRAALMPLLAPEPVS